MKHVMDKFRFILLVVFVSYKTLGESVESNSGGHEYLYHVLQKITKLELKNTQWETTVAALTTNLEGNTEVFVHIFLKVNYDLSKLYVLAFFGWIRYSYIVV